MIGIEHVVNLTKSWDLLLLEQMIDEKILEKAKSGKNNAVFCIANYNDDLYEKYKKLMKKYETTYDISYGKNHFDDYLITISWQKRLERND